MKKLTWLLVFTCAFAGCEQGKFCLTTDDIPKMVQAENATTSPLAEWTTGSPDSHPDQLDSDSAPAKSAKPGTYINIGIWKNSEWGLCRYDPTILHCAAGDKTCTQIAKIPVCTEKQKPALVSPFEHQN